MADNGWTAEEADALRAAIGHFVRVGRTHDVMSRPQATALGELDREGPLTIAELARRSGVRHQTMRVTIAALQEADAISVTHSGTDGRKVYVRITRQGRKLLDRDRDARTAWILDAIEHRLTTRQQATARQIATILRRMASEGSEAAASD